MLCRPLRRTLGASPRTYRRARTADLPTARRASTYPNLVRALVQLEGDGGLSLSNAAMQELAEVRKRIFAAAEADITTVAETLVRAAGGNEFWETLPEEAQRILTGNGPAVLAELRGGYPETTVEQLASIRRPTLLMLARTAVPAKS